MTAAVVLALAFLLGAVVGFAGRYQRIRSRAYAVCQEQARSEHGARRAVHVNGALPARDRSPDHQMVTRPLRSSVVRPYEPR